VIGNPGSATLKISIGLLSLVNKLNTFVGQNSSDNSDGASQPTPRGAFELLVMLRPCLQEPAQDLSKTSDPSKPSQAKFDPKAKAKETRLKRALESNVHSGSTAEAIASDITSLSKRLVAFDFVCETVLNDFHSLEEKLKTYESDSAVIQDNVAMLKKMYGGVSDALSCYATRAIQWRDKLDAA